MTTEFDWLKATREALECINKLASANVATSVDAGRNLQRIADRSAAALEALPLALSVSAVPSSGELGQIDP